MPTIPKGIDSLPGHQVPDGWSSNWFIQLLKTWLGFGDVRNGTGANGITISGSGTTPVTIGLSTNGVQHSSLQQSVSTSVLGNPTNAAGNVVDIQSTIDGQVFVRKNGTLQWVSGLNITVTTAALTPGGTQGQMTFQNGVLTSQTQAT